MKTFPQIFEFNQFAEKYFGRGIHMDPHMRVHDGESMKEGLWQKFCDRTLH